MLVQKYHKTPQNGNPTLDRAQEILRTPITAGVDYDTLVTQLLEKSPAQLRGYLPTLRERTRETLQEWIGGSGLTPATALANIILLQGSPFLNVMVSSLTRAIGKSKKNQKDNSIADVIRNLYKSEKNQKEHRIVDYYKSLYYAHCEQGGWGFFGYEAHVEGGALKLTANLTAPFIKFWVPRKDEQGEDIKYEHPPESNPTPRLPQPSETFVYALASRCNDKGPFRCQGKEVSEVPVEWILGGETDEEVATRYWSFVYENESIPIAITEGIKKACSLGEVGLPAICLAGVTMWRKNTLPLSWEEKQKLKAQLQKLEKELREKGEPEHVIISEVEKAQQAFNDSIIAKVLEQRKSELQREGHSEEGIECKLKELEASLRKKDALAETISTFNQPKRVIFLCFDSEAAFKLDSRISVTRQVAALGKALLAEHGSGANAAPRVKVLKWDSAKGKGIDDYLLVYPTVEQKIKALNKLCRNAITPTKAAQYAYRYKAQKKRIKTYLEVTQISGKEKSLPSVQTVELDPTGKFPDFSQWGKKSQEILTKGGWLFIQSPLGSGKTHVMGRLLQKFVRREIPLGGIWYTHSVDTPPVFVVALTPTNTLGHHLVQRFNHLVAAPEDRQTQFIHRHSLPDYSLLTNYFGLVTCLEGSFLQEEQLLGISFLLPPERHNRFPDPRSAGQAEREALDALLQGHEERVEAVCQAVEKLHPPLAEILRSFSHLVDKAFLQQCFDDPLGLEPEWKAIAGRYERVLRFFEYFYAVIRDDDPDTQPKLYWELNRLYRYLLRKLDIFFQDNDPHDLHSAPVKPLKDCSQALLDWVEKTLADLNLIVLIDEVDTVVKTLVEGRTSDLKTWPRNLALFAELISRAKLVLGVQATISPEVVQFLQNLSYTHREPHVLIAQPRPQLHAGQLYQYWGTQKSYRDLGAYLYAMMQSILAGKRILVTMSSKRRARQLSRFLEQQLNSTGRQKYKILQVDADNSKEFGLFFQNPDEFLQQRKPHVLIATPCMKTGLSIDGDHFDEVWGMFFSGHPVDIDQILGRVRKPVPRHVWITDYFPDKESQLLHLKRNTHANLVQQLATEYRNAYEDCFNSPLLKASDKRPHLRYRGFTKKQIEAVDRLYAEVKLEANYGNFVPAYILTEWYKQRGWSIHHILLGSIPPAPHLEAAKEENPFLREQKWNEDLTELAHAFMRIKDEIIFEQAKALQESGCVSPTEVSAILSSPRSSQADRLAAWKTSLLYGLDGFEERLQQFSTPELVELAFFEECVKTHGRFLSGPKMWAACLTEDGGEHEAAKRAASLAAHGNFNPGFAPTWVKVQQLLKEVGFVEFALAHEPDPDGTPKPYSVNDPDVQALMTRIKERAEEFQRQCNLDVNSLPPMRVIGILHHKLGRKQKCWKRPQTEDGSRYREYVLEPPTPQWQLVAQCHLAWLQNREQREKNESHLACFSWLEKRKRKKPQKSIASTNATEPPASMGEGAARVDANPSPWAKVSPWLDYGDSHEPDDSFPYAYEPWADVFIDGLETDETVDSDAQNLSDNDKIWWNPDPPWSDYN